MAGCKLHGALDSIGTMRVMTSLFEHDVEFEFVPVDLGAGEHLTDAFLSLSPFGEIPLFQDGDLTVFESRAVMRYISHEYIKPGVKHIYMAPLLQGLVATWIDVATHQFEPVATELLLLSNCQRKDIVDDDVEDRMARVLDVYEERLSGSLFLGGDKFTSADLTHMPYLYKLMGTPAMKRLVEARPNVKAWCDRILARPAWARVLEMVNNGQVAR